MTGLSRRFRWALELAWRIMEVLRMGLFHLEMQSRDLRLNDIRRSERCPKMYSECTVMTSSLVRIPSYNDTAAKRGH